MANKQSKTQLEKNVFSLMIKSILWFLFLLTIIFSYTIFTNINSQLESLNANGHQHIEKSSIITNMTINENVNKKSLFTIDEYEVRSDFSISVDIHNNEDHYAIFEISGDIIFIFLSILVMALSVFLLKMHYLNKIINEANTRIYQNLQDSEQKLGDNTLSLLSENIHHELKTPLVVIGSKLNTLKEQFTEVIKETITYKGDCHRSVDNLILGIAEAEDKEGLSVEAIEAIKDFDLIETHVNVIYNVLERMKDYKNIKNDNRNRSIYDLIEVSCKTLTLFSKNNFQYTIDPKTKQYMVNDALSNEDLINIFINHIKNSLEANSTKIEVHMVKYAKGIVYLQLMDNGDGIPSEAKKRVFTEHFSTKGTEHAGSRGIGLYLSKLTLNTFGGDDFLITSSDKGTSFGINIPSNRRG